jgi:hypothetical protein
MLRFLEKFNPAVDRKWLQLAAGLMWSGVGVMLVGFAARWLKPVNLPSLLLLILAWATLGAAIHMFGISKLARKNINRINAYMKDRICLFAFQGWKSYPLVAFMVFLGIYLRVYSPVPKPLLAIAYLGLGFSLFASSLLYYRQLGRRRDIPPTVERE